MLDVLSITGPIYLLVGLGFISCKLGVFKAADLRILGQFVVQFGLSAVLFHALTQQRFTDILSLTYLAAYGGGALVAWLLGVLLCRMRGESLSAASFYGMGMSLPNNGFMGSALVAQMLGPVAGIGLAHCLLFENLIIVPLTLMLAEMQRARDDGAVAHPIRIAAYAMTRVLRTPFILAAIVGVFVTMVQLPIPAMATRAIDLLAISASPVALFVVGGTLAMQTSRSESLERIGEVALGKLVIHPLAVLLILLWLPSIDPVLSIQAVVYACMPMVTVYPVLAQRYGLDNLCATRVVVTTTLSFITVGAWLWVLHRVVGW